MLSRNEILLERRLQDIEAALYSAGRPLTLSQIKPVLKTRSDKVTKKIIKSLKSRYNKRNRALEVVMLGDDRAVMQLRPDYEDFVNQFNNKPLLKLGPLKTLSYIAFHQPVDQRQVIADRGNHTYSHLKMMENMGLIYRERTDERSYIITTTSFYSDYFGFSHNPERSKLQLKQVFRELKITKMENDEIENLFDGIIEGLDDLDELKEEGLTDSGDGFTQGLPQYASSTNNSSK
jgi:segregation and condensation protein B